MPRTSLTTAFLVLLAHVCHPVLADEPDAGSKDESSAPAAAPPEPPAPPPATQPEPEQIHLRDNLKSLLASGLPENVPVDGLFNGSLSSPALLADRVKELPAELSSLEVALKQPGAAREIIGLQREIGRLRLSYLESIQAVMENMTPPVRQVFFSLSEPRAAIRQRAESVRGMAEALERAGERFSRLRHRLSTGALVGFQAERERLARESGQLLENTREAAQESLSLAAALEATADRIEANALTIRRQILTGIKASDRQARFDQLFVDQLKELRKLARLPIEHDRTLVEPVRITAAVNGLVPRPETLGTLSEVDRLILQAQAEFEGLVLRLQAARRGVERWREPFQRELVSLLTHLASEQVRSRAYSLSTELWDDLQADAAGAWEEARSWAAGKLEQIKNLPGILATAEGLTWLLRWLSAILLIGLAIGLRRRLGQAVSYLVRRLGGIGFFKRRIGLLVRMGGLAHALFPTLVVLAVGYAALALMGLDSAEVQFIEVAFRWTVLYLLGRQLLMGLTRQIARGRPALLQVTPATVNLLKITYGRLGLMLVVVATLDEWSRNWLGAGSLSVIVRWVIWIWLTGWALWAMFAWRKTLGDQLAEQSRENSRLQRTGAAVARRRLGALLVPLVFLLLGAIQLIRAFRFLLTAGGFYSWLRARSLRREAEKQVAETGVSLPEKYLKEFPLYPILGEEEALLLPRDKQLGEALEQIRAWSGTRREGSLVLVGEKGAGKTTLLSILARRLGSIPVIRHSLSRKLTTEKGLVEELGPALGLENAANLGVLTSHLNGGEEKVVLLDEGHNLFLRTVDGYKAYEAFVRLVTFTSERIFWVVVFNSFAWNFINHSRRKVHYFRQLLKLPPWTIDELQELIASRNKKAGLTIQFNQVLLDEGRSTTGDIELLESAEGYFRLLRDASGGNPRVATHLWLKSLKPIGPDRLRVGLFREETTGEIQELDPELHFALAAICQHENLSVNELHRVLNLPLDFAAFAVRFLSEYGYVEPKHTDPRRVTLAPQTYQQILKVLRDKHLLFEEA